MYGLLGTKDNLLLSAKKICDEDIPLAPASIKGPFCFLKGKMKLPPPTHKSRGQVRCSGALERQTPGGHASPPGITPKGSDDKQAEHRGGGWECQGFGGQRPRMIALSGGLSGTLCEDELWKCSAPIWKIFLAREGIRFWGATEGWRWAPPGLSASQGRGTTVLSPRLGWVFSSHTAGITWKGQGLFLVDNTAAIIVQHNKTDNRHNKHSSNT